jgi:hypothetical protein
MGIRIVAAFTTPHGFPVSEVYCRIKRVILDPIRDPEYIVTIYFETHLSREDRLMYKETIQVPGITDMITVQASTGDMTSFYQYLKDFLVSQNFAIEDVIEPPPAPVEEPPAETPPAPVEEPPAETPPS